MNIFSLPRTSPVFISTSSISMVVLPKSTQRPKCSLTVSPASRRRSSQPLPSNTMTAVAAQPLFFRISLASPRTAGRIRTASFSPSPRRIRSCRGTASSGAGGFSFKNTFLLHPSVIRLLPSQKEASQKLSFEIPPYFLYSFPFSYPAAYPRRSSCTTCGSPCRSARRDAPLPASA